MSREKSKIKENKKQKQKKRKGGESQLFFL
jgi:hypothetical protein